MKKLIAIAAIVFATSASAASVNNSSHDMSVYTNGTADVCYYCHAAHHTSMNSAPLWARNAWSGTGYAFYESSTVIANVSTLDVVSQACMSCHDGTIAVNETIKGTYGTAETIPNTATTYLGTNLTNDHPVNVVYTEGRAGLGAATSIAPFRLYAVTGGAGGTGVTCGSCHKVHDNEFGNFLRADPAGDLICATCHSAK